MRSLKFLLRIWITLTSLVTFIAGWIMLAHSPKPVQAAQSTGNSTLPTLEPLPPLSAFNSSEDNQSQLFFDSAPQFRRGSSPFFRTGGS